MRKNFNLEWGYLAPAPSFVRTVPIALLGMVIAATASGGVVLSLIDRPASQTSVVAHTSAPYVQAAPTPVGAPETEQLKRLAAFQNESTKDSGADGHLGGAAAPIPELPLPEVHPDEAAAKATTAPPTAGTMSQRITTRRAADYSDLYRASAIRTEPGANRIVRDIGAGLIRIVEAAITPGAISGG